MKCNPTVNRKYCPNSKSSPRPGLSSPLILQAYFSPDTIMAIIRSNKCPLLAEQADNLSCPVHRRPE